jgi:hypothetical protein
MREEEAVEQIYLGDVVLAGGGPSEAIVLEPKDR